MKQEVNFEDLGFDTQFPYLSTLFLSGYKRLKGEVPWFACAFNFSGRLQTSVKMSGDVFKHVHQKQECPKAEVAETPKVEGATAAATEVPADDTECQLLNKIMTKLLAPVQEVRKPCLQREGINWVVTDGVSHITEIKLKILQRVIFTDLGFEGFTFLTRL